MSLPKVTILFSNGNLLQDVAAIDGIAAIVGTGTTAGLLGVPKTIFSLADAETQGFTEAAEPDMHRHLQEFYGEVGGNQELHIMILADTVTLANMLDDTVETGAKKLISAAGGVVRLLGVFRKPPQDYDPGTDFLDSDVSAAVIKAQTFGNSRVADLTPLRILIEGRLAVEAAATIYSPNTADNGYVGIVLGGSQNDLSASVGLALGRAVKYAAEIKIGKVANGPLSISKAYIGTKLIQNMTNLQALHDKGYISFMTHPQKAGIYFGIDHMASTDDYRLLAYGRIVDKAAVIAAAVYVEQLESEVDIDDHGKISELDLKHLEGLITQQITAGMGDQISGATAYIDPSQVIEENSTLNLKLSIRPKGYTSYINIDLGLQAPAVS